MNERFASQVGINQSGDDADLVQTNDGGEELNAVLHDHADRIATTHALVFERMGVAIAHRVELGPGDRLTFENHRHPIGKRFRIARHLS